MSGSVSTTDRRSGRGAGRAVILRAPWTNGYLRTAAILDGLCALAAGMVALELRFDAQGYAPSEYFAFTSVLPFLWLCSVALAGGYDPRFIGVGSDEFRKI